MNQKYYIHKRYWYGVSGDPLDAVRAEHPFASLCASDFEEVSAEEYEETVLDWRFEDGEWRQ